MSLRNILNEALQTIGSAAAKRLLQRLPSARPNPRSLLPNLAGPRAPISPADRALGNTLREASERAPQAVDPRRFLPDLTSPRAPISPVDVNLANRVRNLPEFRRQEASELFDRLRGTAPPARPIPTSAENTLQGTFLRPGPGEVAGGQARLRYAPGTPGVGGTRLGNKTYGTAAEAGVRQGPVPPPNRLNLDEMRAQERLARQMEFEQGIPISRPSEIRGQPIFTEPSPLAGRIEVKPPRPELNIVRAADNPPNEFLTEADGLPNLLVIPNKVAALRAAEMRAAAGRIVPTNRVVLDAAGNAVDEVAPLAAANPRAFLPNLQGPSVPVREIDQILAAELRNAAGGVQMTDLSRMLRDPVFRAGIIGAGAVGAGVGVYNTFSNNEGSAPLGQQPSTTSPPPGEPLVTPTSLNPTPNVLVRENDGTMLGSLDSATTSQLQPGLPPPAPRLPDPTAPARVTTTGSMGADSDRRGQLEQYSRRAAAVNRALEPRSPENYRSAEDYYAAREAYTQQAPVRQALMKYVEGTSSDPTEAAALRTWAQSYPMLAYQLQQQNLANPEANQQSGQSVMTTRVVTPMGSDTPTNAIGNVEATTAASVDPNQGNFELVDATRPMQQPQLQPQEAFMEEFLRRMSDPRREMPYQ